MRLIEEGIRVNPSIIIYLLYPGSKTFKKQLEALFSNHVDYYDVRELIEQLEEEMVLKNFLKERMFKSHSVF